MLQVAVMVGVFAGAIGFGWMSDNLGRQKCLCVALILRGPECFLARLLQVSI